MFPTFGKYKNMWSKFFNKLILNVSQRGRQLCYFITLYDPRTHPYMTILNKPLFNIATLFDHIRYNLKSLWDNEQNMLIYCQTIWFQGHHKHKLWINHNSIEYGFQDDTIYKEGYTYSLLLLNYIILNIMVCVPFMCRVSTWYKN